MTVTVNSPDTNPSAQAPKRRLAAGVVTAVVVAVGAGIGIGLAGSGPTGSAAGPANPSVASSYAYYQSMMGRYELGPAMMGGPGYGWMMGDTGYAWMVGGASAPVWMAGGTLPGFMMGGSRDMGQVMGSLFADAAGARVSPSRAAAVGDQVPAGAAVDRSANRVTFTARTVKLAAVASPAAGPDDTFRIAGMVNPTIVVPPAAQVTIQVINADRDTAHGLVVTGPNSPAVSSSYMPMMAATPAFPGSALWFLGHPTSAGMHAGTVSFTANSTGSYRYLCPVPGHAQKGMVGTLIVN